MPKYLRSPQPTVVLLSRQNGKLRVERAGSQMGLVTRSLVEVVNWERVRMSMGSDAPVHRSEGVVPAFLFDLDGTLVDELEKAGPYRTYEDPLDLMNHLDEVGVRTREDLI